MNRWRFEPMPREEAQRIHEASRRALRAIIAGESPQTSADARAMSFQAETYHERLTAERLVRWGWSPPPLRLFERCGHCHGTGYQHQHRCGMCRGKGYFESERVQ